MRLILLPLALMGCVTINVDAPNSGQPVAPAKCNASDYSQFIGLKTTQVSLPPNLRTRVLNPQSLVSADFQPNRLNVFVDSFGVVQRFSCG